MAGAESNSPTQQDDSQITPEISKTLAEMEGSESKLPTQQDDSQGSLEIFYTFGKTGKVIQESVKDILEEIEDEKISEMTAEDHDKKKSYVTKQLTELLRLHRMLANQHFHLMEEVRRNCPSLIKYQHLDSSDLNDKKLQCDESDLEKARKTLLVAKGIISSMKGEDDQDLLAWVCMHRKLDREEKDRHKSEILRLEETLKSKENIWNREVVELKGKVKNKSKLFEDLKKQLNTVKSDKYKISGKLETLKEEKCSQEKLIQELETRLKNAEKPEKELTLKVAGLERVLDRQRKVISVNKEEKTRINVKLEMLEAEKCSKEKSIQELETRLKNAEKSEKELALKVAKLEREMDRQRKVITVNKEEKTRMNAKLETPEEEKCSKEKLIQELETRLNALQVDNEKIVWLLDNARELENGLRWKVVELEREVGRQMEVNSVTTGEKNRISGMLMTLETRLNAQQAQHDQVVSSIVNQLQDEHEGLVSLFVNRLRVERERVVSLLVNQLQVESEPAVLYGNQLQVEHEQVVSVIVNRLQALRTRAVRLFDNAR